MIRQYLAATRAAFMVGIVYRFGFIFTIIGSFVYLGVAYFLWRSIYASQESMRGLTFNQAFLYVALGSAIFVLLKTYTDWELAYQIREGMIASLLIKPIDFQLYTLFISFGLFLINVLAITLPTFLALVFFFRVEFPLGPGVALFPASLVLAFLVSFAIDYFIGLLGFYTESTWGLATTKDIIITVFSGALVPLQFFPQAMQDVLFFLPFQAIYHTPIMMLTRPDLPLAELLAMLGVQGFWALALLLLSRLFYNQAIKVLRISGG